MKSFITGSRAYGTPREDSDIDVVVLFDAKSLEQIRAMADQSESVAKNPESDGQGEISSGSFRFGRLNLIAVTKESDFAIWRTGTQQLQAVAPVTRDFATEHFRRLREKEAKDEKAFDLL